MLRWGCTRKLLGIRVKLSSKRECGSKRFKGVPRHASVGVHLQITWNWSLQGVRGEFGWVRFLVVCFLYKTNPNPRKIICSGKKWPNCHFQPKFCWVGLALGWGVRRFRNNISMFPNPTELGVSQTPHWNTNTTMVDIGRPTTQWLILGY